MMIQRCNAAIFSFCLLVFFVSVVLQASANVYFSPVSEQECEQPCLDLSVCEQLPSSDIPEKPAVIIPELQVLRISNAWGEVSLDATTVYTELVISDPNLFLVPLQVQCDIYLNDIKMVGGIGKNLQMTACASGTSVRFFNIIANENMVTWWASHINNGEKTAIKIEGKLFVSLDKVDIVFPYSYESEFETDFFGNN